MICLSIVSHGQAPIVGRLLDCIRRSIAAGEPGAGLVSQVIYTRNIPEPDVGPDLTGLPRLTVIDNSVPKGFGHNHNAAFSHCEAPFFCVLNPDIEWIGNPFPALLGCLEATEQRRGLVAPRVVAPGGRIENTARRLYTPREMLRQKYQPSNKGPDADWVAGMFMLFRTDAYAQIGGFDERYFLYIEDVDICSRLRLAGWTLAQCAQATVIHDARNMSHRSPRYMLWHLAGMLRYWRSPSFWRYRTLLRSGKPR